MKRMLLAVAVLVLVVACGSSGAPEQSKSNATAVAGGPDGEKIYKQYCVTCHGLYGDMGASGAHDLTKSQLPLEERIAVITKGRNTMTGFESILDEARIKAVAEYVVKLRK